jgi:hypothetical protein
MLFDFYGISRGEEHEVRKNYILVFTAFVRFVVATVD